MPRIPTFTGWDLMRPTLDQEETIQAIEQRLEIHFTGSNRKDATDFIRKYNTVAVRKSASLGQKREQTERMIDAMFDAESYGDR